MARREGCLLIERIRGVLRTPADRDDLPHFVQMFFVGIALSLSRLEAEYGTQLDSRHAQQESRKENKLLGAF